MIPFHLLLEDLPFEGLPPGNLYQPGFCYINLQL